MHSTKSFGNPITKPSCVTELPDELLALRISVSFVTLRDLGLRPRFK
jgi:hypothetical protein